MPPTPRKNRFHRRQLAAFLAPTALAAPVVLADTDDWTANTGNWSTAGNWSLINPPSPGDTVNLTQSDSTTRIVTYDAAATSGTGFAQLTIDATGSGSMTLSQGTGLLLVGGATTNSGQFTQTGGTATFHAVTGGGIMSIGGGTSSASSFVNSFQQSRVNIASGGYLSVATNTTDVTNTATTLSITGTGQLDLGNNSLITTTPASTIRQYLTSGYNGGAWNGSGIMSSVAAASTNAGGILMPPALAVGYSSGSGTVGALWLGLPSNQTVVKLTAAGDADLDGVVDISDQSLVLANYLSGKPGTWDTGDFNYDQVVDISDLNILFNNYFGQAPNYTSPLPLSALRAKRTSGTAATSNLAAVSHTLAGTASLPDYVPTPAPNTLELLVNVWIGNGNVEVIGNNTQVVDMQITSPSGGLITANWHDLKSQGYANWSDAAKTPTGIAEYDEHYIDFGDYALVNDISLGQIGPANIYPQQLDWVFKYGVVDPVTGLVDTLTGSIFYDTVPEPTVLGMIGMGAGALLSRRRKRSSKPLLVP